MNFSSNLFAAIIPILIGFVVQITGNYYIAMMFFAVVVVGYLICSLMINFDNNMEINNESVQRVLMTPFTVLVMMTKNAYTG